jgi:ribulose-phosphate 3-epimerase
MAKLAASILSADLARLAEQVKLVERHVDLIHVDVMDAHFVPPLTIGPPMIAALRRHTALPLHAHLQVESPEGLLEDLAEAGTDAVAFHVEAAEDPAPLIRKAAATGVRVGVALGPPTPFDRAAQHLDEIDDLIVLTVHPGWAGQPFQPDALGKVEAARAEIDRRGLTVDVHVDGGVNARTVRRCIDAGADVVAAASAIFGAADPAGAARELRGLAGGA